MAAKKIHLYFVPGLAASSSIFKFIQLPEDLYEIHFLEWLVPESKDEPLTHYAKRMCERITEDNFVLLGVSFGGIVVQEMSAFCKPLKIIIISSVKHHQEFPGRFKVIRKTKAYKLAPIKSLTNIENFEKYAFGKVAKKRLSLYKEYLSMRDKNYLPWAIYHVLHWKQNSDFKNIIHIHGNNDGIFPIKNITNCIPIEGGTHIMILNKAKKINRILAEVLKE
jgi:pimeloyl-ACP methyl ester carboxylesterase